MPGWGVFVPAARRAGSRWSGSAIVAPECYEVRLHGRGQVRSCSVIRFDVRWRTKDTSRQKTPPNATYRRQTKDLTRQLGSYRQLCRWELALLLAAELFEQHLRHRLLRGFERQRRDDRHMSEQGDQREI